MTAKLQAVLIILGFCFTLLLTSCAPPDRDNGAQEIDDYKIKLNSRSFTPEPDIKALEEIKSYKESRHRMILQFNKPLRLEDHKLLFDESVILLEYLQANSYLASVPAGLMESKQTFADLIRWAGELNPEDKLQSDLAAGRIHKWALDPRTKKLKTLVEFFADVSRDEVVSALSSLGLKGVPYGANNSWSVLIEETNVLKLSESPLVKVIGQGPAPPIPLNDNGRRTSNTDDAQAPIYWGPSRPDYKLSGELVRVGICDDGIDENHDDFLDPWRFQRVYNIRSGGSDHGTLTASIVGGSGANSADFARPAFSLRGHAPECMLGDYPQFSGNAGLYYNAIVNDGTDITNHSYGEASDYTTKCASIDIIVRGDAEYEGSAVPARPQVWAVGNDGLINSELYGEEGYYSTAQSKNTISVGAVSAETGRLMDYSSLGPTFDGRIKPDLVAPSNVMAAKYNTQEYKLGSGTSSSAPAVSGIIALMMERYKIAFGEEPYLNPSTYKAILVHTARDQIKTSPYEGSEWVNPDLGGPVLFYEGPDFATGFGLVDAKAAVDKIAENNGWLESTFAEAGDIHRYTINVENGSGPLKVVIAWDDLAGPTGVGPTVKKLVNDLDLVLRDPNGVEYLPWTLHPLPVTANPGNGGLDPITENDLVPALRGEDHINNVEMVSVCDPVQGEWEVQVTAHALPMGTAQTYSLVGTHITLFRLLDNPFMEKLPWLDVALQTAPLKVIPDIFEIEIFKSVISIDRICQFVLDCPGCYGHGWSYCPGMEITLDGLKQNVAAIVFNEKGKLRAEDKSGTRVRKIKVEKIRPGEQLFVALTDGLGNPLEGSTKLKVGLRPIDD